MKKSEKLRKLVMKFYNKYIHIRVILLLLIVPLVSVSVAAQDAYQNSFSFDSGDTRYFDQVKKKYSKAFEEGHYPEILSILRDDFLHSSDLWNGDSVRDERDKFIAALDHFRQELDVILNSGSGRLDRIPGGFFDQADRTITGRPLRFFADHPDYEIIVTADSLTLSQAVDLRYRMNTLSRITDAITKDDRLAVEQALVSLNTQWDNFHFNSKSQYPWEFLVNSWLLKSKRPIITPPGAQLVLAHPNISLEVDTGDKHALQVHQTYNMEIIGAAFNFNDYEDYISVSLLGSINNELGNGYGGMISYNGTQLGLVFHDRTGKQANLILTLDLFKFFQNAGNQWGKLRN